MRSLRSLGIVCCDTNEPNTANFRPYYFWPLVLASSTIAQHVSSIFIFLVTFVRLHNGTWDPRVLVYFSVAMFLVGLFAWELLGWSVLKYSMSKEQSEFISCERVDHASDSAKGAKVLKSSILLFLALLALSPVLRSLSASTSSDSIWALCACLFILNVLLADYRPPLSSKLGQEKYA